MTASVSSTVTNVFPFNNAVSGAYGGVNNVESYLDRTNGETVAVGVIRKFAGFYHRCVFPGTLAGAEPTIIAPLGAPELINDVGFDNPANWTVLNSGVVSGSKASLPISNSQVRQAATIINTYSYMFEYDIDSIADRINAYLGIAQDVGTAFNTTGHKQDIITATTNHTAIGFQGVGGTPTVIMDTASLKQVTLDGTAAWETIEII